jgi:hypothetical protein
MKLAVNSRARISAEEFLKNFWGILVRSGGIMWCMMVGFRRFLHVVIFRDVSFTHYLPDCTAVSNKLVGAWVTACVTNKHFSLNMKLYECDTSSAFLFTHFNVTNLLRNLQIFFFCFSVQKCKDA